MALQNTEQLKFHQDQKLAIVCISDYWSMKCFHAELLDLAQTETKLCTKVKSSLSDCLIRELYNLSLVRLKLWRTCLHVQNRFVCFHIKVIYLKKKKKTSLQELYQIKERMIALTTPNCFCQLYGIYRPGCCCIRRSGRKLGTVVKDFWSWHALWNGKFSDSALKLKSDTAFL